MAVLRYLFYLCCQHQLTSVLYLFCLFTLVFIITPFTAHRLFIVHHHHLSVCSLMPISPVFSFFSFLFSTFLSTLYDFIWLLQKLLLIIVQQPVLLGCIKQGMQHQFTFFFLFFCFLLINWCIGIQKNMVEQEFSITANIISKQRKKERKKKHEKMVKSDILEHSSAICLL